LSDFPPRVAELVLVDARGAVLGALEPIEVASPWWNDIGPLLDALRARDGLRPTVLRLLWTARENQPGGAVRYLAEVAAPVPAQLLRPWAGTLPDHPLRQAYARVGGPAADLAWARGVLQAQGLAANGPPQQIRTWNLSALWRLPTAGGGTAWLKVVPPFFAHEGQVLEMLAGHPVPRLLGRDGARMLLAPIEGEDLYDADLSCCRAMVDLLVDLQATWQGRGDELAALGLPDWRGPAYTKAAASLLQRRGAELSAAQQDGLDGVCARAAAALGGDCRMRPRRRADAWRLPSRQLSRHAQPLDLAGLGRQRCGPPLAGPAGPAVACPLHLGSKHCKRTGCRPGGAISRGPMWRVQPACWNPSPVCARRWSTSASWTRSKTPNTLITGPTCPIGWSARPQILSRGAAG
jgi:hypothetical protein